MLVFFSRSFFFIVVLVYYDVSNSPNANKESRKFFISFLFSPFFFYKTAEVETEAGGQNWVKKSTHTLSIFYTAYIGQFLSSPLSFSFNDKLGRVN